ncbi:hypothetical protein [Lysobacter sp. CA199]|uniref:hypothetical protein n=1 Tax=Lysobacter sp. CA199 TaxID=3455608 RepID=UPI003F8D5900
MPAERASWRTAVLVALFFTALAAIALRQDANWDLRNYHLYAPLAWMEGRLDGDIAAAQLQTWHNPIVDIPFALMVRAGLGGVPITVWLAIPCVLGLYFGLRLLDTLMPAQRSRARTWIAGFVLITGAAAYPSTGATFNDQFVGAFVLGAVYWWARSQGRRGPVATWLPVGLFAGAAAGLKLTGITYCLGFIAAALIAGPVRQLPLRVGALALGGGVGAALCWGPWGWYLWREHGNPLFPYFNHWFLSPDTVPDAWRDLRYLPKSPLEMLDSPLRLLRRSRNFSEQVLADPRVLLGLLALGGWMWLRRDRALAAVAGPAAGAANTASADAVAPAVALAAAEHNAAALRWPLLAFVLISYLSWLLIQSIYRYLLPLELLFSALIVGTVSMLFAWRWTRTAMLVAMVLVVAPTKHPSWGRDPYRSPMIEVRFPPLPNDSIVLTSTDSPIGHAVAFLPAEVPAMAIRNNFMDPQRCTRLQERVERTIAGHAGPLWLLRPEQVDYPAADRIALYGLSVGGTCLAVEDSLAEIELCPLARASFKPICTTEK